MKRIVFFGVLVGLSGCGALERVTPDFLRQDPPPATDEPPATQPEVESNTLATPSPAPRPPGGELGVVIVSLGDPSQPGMWVKTALVDTPTPGRLITQDGATLTVDLLPLGAGADGGAQISLEALRALGLPLTGLAPITLSVL